MAARRSKPEPARFAVSARLHLILGVVLVLAITALQISTQKTATAHDLRETVAAIKPSVVGVGTYLATRRPPAQVRGTGFVVADGLHVVTNAHVVDGELNEGRRETIAVFAGSGTRVERRTAKVVIADAEHDLALLRIDGAPLPPVQLGDSEQTADGQAVAFTGFPIGTVLGLYPATHRGIIAARVPIAIPQQTARVLDEQMIRQLKDPFLVFQLDATAYPGNSGSPLYDAETGQVLGVISSVFVKGSRERVMQDPSGITYAVPSRYVEDLLDAISE